MPHLAAKNWSSCARRALRGLLYHDQWMIGVIDEPIANVLKWKKPPKVRWIEPLAKTRSLAAPFPWPGSDDTLLCETLDLSTRAKKIAAVKINAEGIEAEINLDLPLPEPLAFPFLFMREGVVYALPDAGASKRLEILRWQEQEGVWVSHAVVFEDRPAVNAVLYEKDGWFWISYTDLAKMPRDNLHLVYSSRLTGPWKLHSANPVQTGRKASRNAGAVFKVGKKLYRPAQEEAAFPGALRVMEIVMCTPLAYEEREVARLAPPDAAFPDGIRTLSAWGDKCLIDGLRQVFSFPRALDKLHERLRRLGIKYPARPSSSL